MNTHDGTICACDECTGSVSIVDAKRKLKLYLAEAIPGTERYWSEDFGLMFSVAIPERDLRDGLVDKLFEHQEEIAEIGYCFIPQDDPEYFGAMFYHLDSME